MTGQFRKYDHLERPNHVEVNGITEGDVYVFPKLDGTNSSVWRDVGTVCGSRNRVLSIDKDNQGFATWVYGEDQKAEKLSIVLIEQPHWTIYGEWLVPHTLKTYRPEAWRRFWIFDVYDHEKGRYLSWDDYNPILTGLDLIEPLCTFTNPSEDQLRTLVEQNTYLIADGAGVGEGIVVKNYDWRNRFDRQPWMKIVRNEFKEDSARAHGRPHKSGEFVVEHAIAESFVTPHLVGKARAKIVADIANVCGTDLAGSPNAVQEIEATYRKKIIPQLLGRVFHDLVTEEIWPILKKHKNPTIDFRLLNRHVVQQVKKLSEDLF